MFMRQRSTETTPTLPFEEVAVQELKKARDNDDNPALNTGIRPIGLDFVDVPGMCMSSSSARGGVAVLTHV
jgi:hypothetical protein